MNDLISRQAAMEEISKQQTYKMFEGEDTLYLDANDVGSVLASMPSAQPDEAKVLAEILDGCPLTHPCDKLWSPDGWCKDHCKDNYKEPSAECWLKYAEVVASDSTDTR